MDIAFLTTQVTPLPDAPGKKWDILKSIVYGGSIESITSLNIVTSAASVDAIPHVSFFVFNAPYIKH